MKKVSLALAAVTLALLGCTTSSRPLVPPTATPTYTATATPTLTPAPANCNIVAVSGVHAVPTVTNICGLACTSNECDVCAAVQNTGSSPISVCLQIVNYQGTVCSCLISTVSAGSTYVFHVGVVCGGFNYTFNAYANCYNCTTPTNLCSTITAYMNCP